MITLLLISCYVAGVGNLPQCRRLPVNYAEVSLAEVASMDQFEFQVINANDRSILTGCKYNMKNGEQLLADLPCGM